MKPYYQEAGITIYCADCREVLPTLPKVDLVLTDPPYGIAYKSGWDNEFCGITISGDRDTVIRDYALRKLDGIPAIVFGSWKRPRPSGTKAVLVWDKGTVGMGDLSVPWFPCTEEIYIIGTGWTGTRTSAIMRHVVRNEYHPTEKPVPLIVELLQKCPAGTVLDPFMGSGTTLVAAKQLGRRAIGIEIEEKYCEIAARRLESARLTLFEHAGIETQPWLSELEPPIEGAQ